MKDHDDARNMIIIGKDHQFDWARWDFRNVNSGAGTGSIVLSLFRHSHRSGDADYVDFVLTGDNPSGTISTFSGRGRLHLTCP
jgi:hypothetical protein